MNKKSIITLLVAAIMLFSGCGLMQFANLFKCDFSYGGISNVEWAGINFKDIKNKSDLTVVAAAKAVSAIADRNFVINCDVDVKVKNDTKRPARVIGYDYEFYIEDKLAATGSSKDVEYIINPYSTSVIAVPVRVDLVDIIKKREIGDIINCIRNLMDKGKGEASNVTVKFTPYASVGKEPKRMSTITLNKTIESKQQPIGKPNKNAKNAQSAVNKR